MTRLETLDLGSFAGKTIGDLPGASPLAGTPGGELWAIDGDLLFRIDQRTARVVEQIAIQPAINGPFASLAAAYSHDAFYVFVNSLGGGATVHRVDKRTGQSSLILPNSGRPRIMGAASVACPARR